MARKPIKRGRKAVVKRKPVKRKPINYSAVVPPLAMTVTEWCRAYGVGRNTFYKLLKQGRAPPTIMLGRRRIITLEATLEWQRQREALEIAAATEEEIAA